MVNIKKTETVNHYLEILKDSPHLVLVKFEKIPHLTLEGLRRDLKKTQAKMKVVKNTLLEKAVNHLIGTNRIFTELKKRFFPLRNNTAIITFTADWSAGLKTLYDFAKKETHLNFKCAIIDAQTYDDASLIKLAQLPSRNQLIAKIIGAFKSPGQRLIYDLKYQTNKFVYLLHQKAKR